MTDLLEEKNGKMFDERCIWIVIGPKPDKLVEMMSTKNWPITSKVIEIIHDDSDE